MENLSAKGSEYLARLKALKIPREVAFLWYTFMQGSREKRDRGAHHCQYQMADEGWSLSDANSWKQAGYLQSEGVSWTPGLTTVWVKKC